MSVGILGFIPAVDIDNNLAAKNQIVMSQEDLAQIMRHNDEQLYHIQNDSLPPSGDIASLDTKKQFTVDNELTVLHDYLTGGKKVDVNTTKTVEFGSDGVLHIEVNGEIFGLSIEGEENERFFCIEKNGEKMILARGKPIMAGSATSKFFKKFYLSIADPTTNKIFNEGQEFGLLDSLTSGINEKTGEPFLKISADYVVSENDTTHIDPTIPLSIIKDIFDPTLFDSNTVKQKTRVIEMGNLEKQQLAWGLVGTDSLLNRSLEDLIKEGFSIEEAEFELKRIEEKRNKKYEAYLGDFRHIKAIEFTYKPFNE